MVTHAHTHNRFSTFQGENGKAPLFGAPIVLRNHGGLVGDQVSHIAVQEGRALLHNIKHIHTKAVPLQTWSHTLSALASTPHCRGQSKRCTFPGASQTPCSRCRSFVVKWWCVPRLCAVSVCVCVQFGTRADITDITLKKRPYQQAKW